MLSDCYSCYDTPCTCGRIYEDMDTKTVFRVKQKLEEILFNRQQDIESKLKELKEQLEN